MPSAECFFKKNDTFDIRYKHFRLFNMKHITALLSIALGAVLFFSCNNKSAQNEQTECQGFKLGTGVNVSHWLSQSDRRGEERANQITKADFDSIASMGFEHVRLPIDEVQFYDENLNRDEEAFALLKNAIDWTLENNMNIIVDLHITRAHYFLTADANTLFTETSAQDHMVAIWKDLQKFLKSYPTDRLAYELLNEAVAPTHEALNQLEGRLIAAIREEEPNRYIIVGSNWAQSVETMEFLQVPENDKHLVISFHYYNPLFVTHYGAPWTIYKDCKENVTYPGNLLTDTSFFAGKDEKTVQEYRTQSGVWDKEKMFSQIKKAVDRGKELGLQVYCGEFGAYPNFVNKESRLNWYKDMAAIFKENNIANAHWCYKGDFPIVDDNLTPNEIPAILLGK